MRRRLVGMAVLAAVLATASAGATQPPADWILVSVTAGPSGATDVVLEVRATARVAGDDPSLVGFGFADVSSSLVDVVPAGAGDIRLTTTRAAGGLDLSVIPGSGGRDVAISTTMIADDLRPHDRLVVLVFVPGMTFGSLAVEQPSASTGTLSSWGLTGRGSSSVAAAGAQDGGIGVAAGPAAAGSSSAHTRDVPTGLIGGFVTSGFCVACSGSWHTPDGGGGSFRASETGAAGLTYGAPAFAGDAGRWTWTWSGVGVTRSGTPGTAPALAAYAPVGDAWPLFRPLGV